MNKIIVGGIFLIIVFVMIGVKEELRYPPNWDKVHLGMSRQKVYDLIGPGIDEFPDWKGPFGNAASGFCQ